MYHSYCAESVVFVQYSLRTRPTEAFERPETSGGGINWIGVMFGARRAEYTRACGHANGAIASRGVRIAGDTVESIE